MQNLATHVAFGRKFAMGKLPVVKPDFALKRWIVFEPRRQVFHPRDGLLKIYIDVDVCLPAADRDTFNIGWGDAPILMRAQFSLIVAEMKFSEPRFQNVVANPCPDIFDVSREVFVDCVANFIFGVRRTEGRGCPEQGNSHEKWKYSQR
jgi:hypothetical protein